MPPTVLQIILEGFESLLRTPCISMKHIHCIHERRGLRSIWETNLENGWSKNYAKQPRIILCRFTIMIKCRRLDSLLVRLLVSQLLEYVLASFTPFAKQPFSRHKALLTSDHVYICPQDFQSLKWDPHSSYSNKFQCVSAAFDLILTRHGEWQTANGATKATSPWLVSLFHAALVSLASFYLLAHSTLGPFPSEFPLCWALVNCNVSSRIIIYPVDLFTSLICFSIKIWKACQQKTFEKKTSPNTSEPTWPRCLKGNFRQRAFTIEAPCHAAAQTQNLEPLEDSLQTSQSRMFPKEIY